MEAKRHMVIVIVGDGVVGGKFDKIMGLHLYDVGE